jgi:FkbM family methyltransferase
MTAHEYAATLWRRSRYVTGTAARGLASIVTDFHVLARRARVSPVFRQATINGLHMLVRADEDVGRQIFCLGAFEREESAYLRSCIQSTDKCVDAGANVGYYTLMLAGLAERGEVHAFEPVPLNYHILQCNLILNGVRNVIINRCALADSDDERDFNVAQDSAYSSLTDTGRMPVTARIRVRTETLDRYCTDHRIDKIDFLKVDVEGGEECVLRGAANLLSEPGRRPRLVLLELFQPMLGKHASSIDSIVDWMRGLGYQPFILHEGSKQPFARAHYDHFYNVFFSADSAKS